MRQTLPLVGKRIEASENSSTVAFLKLLIPSSATKGDQVIADGTQVVGRVKHKTLSEKEVTALPEANYNPNVSVPVFSRVRQGLACLPNPTLDGLDMTLTAAINNFVFKVKKLSVSNRTMAVPVSSINAYTSLLSILPMTI